MYLLTIIKKTYKHLFCVKVILLLSKNEDYTIFICIIINEKDRFVQTCGFDTWRHDWQWQYANDWAQDTRGKKITNPISSIIIT